MLDTAISLMQNGATPSVSEVAEAAGVSRATAYRYFPSQASLVQAVVDQALGPILRWRPPPGAAGRRVEHLVDTAMPRIDEFEATFRAALDLSLQQWSRRQAGTLGEEPRLARGHRRELLSQAIAPLGERLPEAEIARLAQALSLVFGVEALVVLKDIWGLDSTSARQVVRWAASALVQAAGGGTGEKEE